MSKSAKSAAVYAGTFDPITNGHLDIIRRARSVFSTVYVAVAGSSSKKVWFSAEERVAMVNEAVSEASLSESVVVQAFDGLLVDYVKKVEADVIVRGLRAVSDYEYEAQMAHINRQLASEIETVFLVTSEDCSFISSSIVKNVAINGGDVSRFVPGIVESRLKKEVEKSK